MYFKILHSSVMLLTWCFLSCLITGSIPLRINVTNVTQSVLLGEEVALQCPYELTDGENVTELYVKWWYWLDDDLNNRMLIYQRFTGQRPQFTQDTSSWSISNDEDDTIVLRAAQLEDSGVYECEVSVGPHEARQQRTLLVYTLGSGLQLNVTRVENKLFAQCSVEDASPEPDLVINVDGVIIDTNFTTEEEINGTIRYSSTIVVDATDTAVFACELYFINPNIVHPSYIQTHEYTRDGCVKLRTTILTPISLVLVQLIYTLQQYLSLK